MDQWKFLSDCTNAQADLNLRWTHMSGGTFSDVTARVSLQHVGKGFQSTIYNKLSVNGGNNKSYLSLNQENFFLLFCFSYHAFMNETKNEYLKSVKITR